MPDPYKDSSPEIQSLVGSIVALRDNQDEIADRITTRDHKVHTGGAAFLVRMERIMGRSTLDQEINEVKVKAKKTRKERGRGRRSRR